MRRPCLAEYDIKTEPNGLRFLLPPEKLFVMSIEQKHHR
ncbi:hypothetical protein VS84_02466 [Vibrio cholerae]|nr:hypothetical protein VS84_02466 [Vibrio cholerae]KKP20811.1 hypothetical protein VS86_01299 [Vibrio cholerae]